MDSAFETMNVELCDCLLKAGVRQDVINKLIDDKLCTAELLNATSDVLLKQCGVKGGQIIQLRFGLQTFIDNCQINPSPPFSPAPSPQLSRPSTPLSTQFSNSRPSTPSSMQLSNSSPSTPSSLPSSPLSVQSSLQYTDNKSETRVKALSIASFGQSNIPASACPSKNWLGHFELPSKFSSGVSDDLKAQSMTSNHRNEFTRDICSSIRAYTMFPTKTEREHVSFMVIKKYPFLADKLQSLPKLLAQMHIRCF